MVLKIRVWDQGLTTRHVSYFVRVVQHLHEVPLAGCSMLGSPVARPAPETVPGLVMPLLLLLVKLAVSLIVVNLFMNLE